MEKTGVVDALGQVQLLLPAWITTALAANDRLKLYLSVLQAARHRATGPGAAPVDLTREAAAAGVDGAWVSEAVATATPDADGVHLPDLPRLRQLLAQDLKLMARPLIDGGHDQAGSHARRVSVWVARLDGMEGNRLEDAVLTALTAGRDTAPDGFHPLVMDLHKSLNRLATELADEQIDGAHVWAIADADRPRIAAFMRGLNRTRPLKFDHPGLETAVTRDGERLLIQNDIGTNDAHVLVVQVQDLRISLTYSDLHRQRFAFFQTMLGMIGAVWSDSESRRTRGLNAGEAYHVGTAIFDCADEAALLGALEGLAARIVFLIDWNRARKRLAPFVSKLDAIAVLTDAATREAGHMAWLVAGGPDLVHGAMQAVGPEYFRIGDRLDEVMGRTAAMAFLVELMVRAREALLRNQPAGVVADDARVMLLAHLRHQVSEFEALADHAGFCHALAEGVRDGLIHGLEHDAATATAFADRAKTWERQADELVMRLREQADRQPHRLPMLRLIERADDVADALEEAAFLLSVIAEGHDQGWTPEVREVLRRLAETTFTAAQDHVRALAIARSLGPDGTADDHEDLVAVLWRIVGAERAADQLLRDVRRVLARHLTDAATLNLATDFAAALELATDALLVTGYGLRDLAFSRMGAGA